MPATSTTLLTALSLSAAMRSLELNAYTEPGCNGGAGGECGGEGGEGGDGGEGGGSGGSGGSSGQAAVTPPPHAQHMVFDEKSSSSKLPHQSRLAVYPEQLSPSKSVAVPSKSRHCGASDRPRITTTSTLGDGDGCVGKNGGCDGEGGGKSGGGGSDTQQPVQSQPELSSSLQRSMP